MSRSQQSPWWAQPGWLAAWLQRPANIAALGNQVSVTFRDFFPFPRRGRGSVQYNASLMWIREMGELLNEYSQLMRSGESLDRLRIRVNPLHIRINALLHPEPGTQADMFASLFYNTILRLARFDLTFGDNAGARTRPSVITDATAGHQLTSAIDRLCDECELPHFDFIHELETTTMLTMLTFIIKQMALPKIDANNTSSIQQDQWFYMANVRGTIRNLTGVELAQLNRRTLRLASLLREERPAYSNTRVWFWRQTLPVIVHEPDGRVRLPPLDANALNSDDNRSDIVADPVSPNAVDAQQYIDSDPASNDNVQARDVESPPVAIDLVSPSPVSWPAVIDLISPVSSGALDDDDDDEKRPDEIVQESSSSSSESHYGSDVEPASSNDDDDNDDDDDQPTLALQSWRSNVVRYLYPVPVDREPELHMQQQQSYEAALARFDLPMFSEENRREVIAMSNFHLRQLMNLRNERQDNQLERDWNMLVNIVSGLVRASGSELILPVEEQAIVATLSQNNLSEPWRLLVESIVESVRRKPMVHMRAAAFVVGLVVIMQMLVDDARRPYDLIDFKRASPATIVRAITNMLIDDLHEYIDPSLVFEGFHKRLATLSPVKRQQAASAKRSRGNGSTPPLLPSAEQAMPPEHGRSSRVKSRGLRLQKSGFKTRRVTNNNKQQAAPSTQLRIRLSALSSTRRQAPQFVEEQENGRSVLVEQELTQSDLKSSPKLLAIIKQQKSAARKRSRASPPPAFAPGPIENRLVLDQLQPQGLAFVPQQQQQQQQQAEQLAQEERDRAELARNQVELRRQMEERKKENARLRAFQQVSCKQHSLTNLVETGCFS